MKVEVEKRVDNVKTTYYKKGTNIIHRDDGPAIIWANGTKKWYKNGKSHRDNAPAEIYADGTQYWYQNGKLHREDGPAIIYNDKTKEYYLNGKKYSEKEYKERLIANEFFFQEL